MGLSRNKVAVSEGAAGSPPFYGERVIRRDRYYVVLRNDLTEISKREMDCCSIFSDGELLKEKVSATNAEGPPVPIPNTEVKLCSGENTLRATVREDSSVLTSRKEAKASFARLTKVKKLLTKHLGV